MEESGKEQMDRKKLTKIITAVVTVLIVAGLVGLLVYLISSSGESPQSATTTPAITASPEPTSEGSTSSDFETTTKLVATTSEDRDDSSPTSSNTINFTTDSDLTSSTSSTSGSTSGTTSGKEQTTTSTPGGGTTDEGTPDGTTPVPEDPERDEFLLRDSKKLNWWTNNPNLKHQTEFYFFNVTNPGDVEKGKKPILQEVGPYTFEERRIYNISGWHENEEFLSLRYRKHYFATTEGKSLDDKVTVLNVPLISLYSIVSGHSFVVKRIAFRIFKNYPLFVTHSVNDLLFNGYEDDFVDRVNRDLKFAGKLGIHLKIPTSIDKNGRFSFMASRNDSDYGLWTVNTGKENVNEMGQLFKINEKSYIKGCWDENSPCATVSGSDGVIFPPLSGEAKEVRLFAPELNRTIQLDYDQDTAATGVSVRKFAWSNNTFKSGTVFPPNKCFVMDPKDKYSEHSGVLFNSHCNFDIPLSFSYPHFYNADSFFSNQVKGLKASQEKHESSIELKKDNGELVLGKKNLQINIDTKVASEKRSFPRIIFPLFWLSETTKNLS